MLMFGILMLVLVVGTIGGVLFFLRWLKKQNPSLAQDGTDDSNRPVQSFFDIVGIDSGILVLTGGRYRVFIEAPSLNIPLMAEEEQLQLEAKFSSMLARISNFPIQFHVQNRPLDMGEVMQQLSNQYDSAPDGLREYANVLTEYLATLSEVSPIWVRRKVIVIPFDDRKATFEEAIRVLDDRARLILAELDACGIEGRCLQTEEIVQLWYTHLNKARSVAQPFRNTVVAGHTHTYVKGESLHAVLQ